MTNSSPKSDYPLSLFFNSKMSRRLIKGHPKFSQFMTHPIVLENLSKTKIASACCIQISLRCHCVYLPKSTSYARQPGNFLLFLGFPIANRIPCLNVMNDNTFQYNVKERQTINIRSSCPRPNGEKKKKFSHVFRTKRELATTKLSPNALLDIRNVFSVDDGF